MSGRRKIPSAKVWPNGEFTLGYKWEGEEGQASEEWAWTGGSNGLSQAELDIRLECMDGSMRWPKLTRCPVAWRPLC